MKYLDDLFSLNGKIIVVTGAAKGNGKVISEALLLSGATVILIDILKEKLSKTAEEFRKQKLRVHEYCIDITDFNEIKNLINFLEKKYKKIDVLINNAGVTFPYESLNYPEELWEKTYQVNLHPSLAPNKPQKDLAEDHYQH